MRRIVVLAPMPMELRPIVKALGLEKSTVGGHGVRTGSIGGVEVTAALAGVGMPAAAAAAERLIEALEPEHVMVVGIAGGVDPSMRIGDLVRPEVVVDVRTGREFRPTPDAPTSASGEVTDAGPRGTLLTANDLLPWADLAEHAERGALAIDMETSAVAEVCERHALAWSVYRSISDRSSEGTVGDDTMNLMRPDGSPDLGAVARLVLTRPWHIPRLARLGRDASRAADVAAGAAVAASRSMASASGGGGDGSDCADAD